MTPRNLTAEEIATAQLEFDVGEAKSTLVREVSEAMPTNPNHAKSLVAALESFCGKFVMRWWFERTVKNRREQGRWTSDKAQQDETERRRQGRTQKLVAIAAMANRLANVRAPDAHALQISLLGLAAEQAGIWQALIDAAIISPQGKQDYLDAGTADLYQRVCGFATRLDVSTKGPPS